ncbi:hypothetical protein [Mycoplasma leonicaptivi]|uniref:hypothetical protein n=1 Tax=Mycoplasma leonicaptivi TaxID=36742 RepID=UPI0004888BBE|nr:hypothetical protein [Mycoplasma leonicaptivi]
MNSTDKKSDSFFNLNDFLLDLEQVILEENNTLLDDIKWTHKLVKKSYLKEQKKEFFHQISLELNQTKNDLNTLEQDFISLKINDLKLKTNTMDNYEFNEHHFDSLLSEIKNQNELIENNESFDKTTKLINN